MKCKCGEKMKFVQCWDDAQETDHAWNLYTCMCGMICKEDVWNHKGNRWINLEGELKYENILRKME